MGTAHAKTILLGEHAVVYGRPAIAFPVASLTLEARAESIGSGLALHTPFHAGAITAEDDAAATREEHIAAVAVRRTLERIGRPLDGVGVSVTGLIPAARGLGSSAAVASAIAVAVAGLHGIALTPADRFEIVQSVERVAHGTPSGLDAYATTAAGPIWFEQGRARTLAVAESPALLVADTGVLGRTGVAVAEVRARHERNPHAIEAAMEGIADLVVGAREDLASAAFADLGERMNACHGVLSSIGVSSTELDALVQAARRAGALGAKLTGGGQGGCIIALAPSASELPALAAALTASGATGVWFVTDGEENA
ncbi:mevalonate kinase [Paramicrobacterium humi]|uniref:mevalonate kinase n=1 Tax=Paramicrobacterium humi TaxID=640635 RepID=UPI0015A2CDA4|nr:mevalonate kinase [Microbacterium humi]